MPLTLFLTSIMWLPLLSSTSSPRWWVAGVGSTIALWTCSVKMSPGHWWGLGLLFYACVSITWSLSPNDALGEATHWLVLAVVYCVASESRSSRYVWLALGLGATVNAVVSIAQVLGVLDLSAYGAYPTWATGLFGNKNFMANFGALAFIGMLMTLRTLRSICTVLLVGSALCWLMPVSRGAIVAVIVALGLRSRWMLALLLAALVAFMIDQWLHPWRALWNSAAPRLEMWDWTISNLHWFGWGAGNYATVFTFEHASNDVLELAFDLGLGGLFAVGLLWYSLRPTLLRTEWCILVAFLVEGMFSFPLHTPATAVVAAWAAGRIAGDRYRWDGAERRVRDHSQARSQDATLIGI